MPPVGAAVAAISATTLGSTLLNAAVGLGVSFGLSALGDALAPKQKNVSRDKRIQGIEGQLDIGGVVDRRFILGSWATYGSLVYWNSWGDGGKTPNKHLVYVIALSDMPISGVTGLWVNGDKTTWNPADAPDGSTGIPVPEFDQGGSHYCWMKFYDGTQTSADTYLTNKFASGSHNYPSTRIGLGVAYAIVTFRIDDKLFAGSAFPEVLFEVDGLKLYDIRKDSTAGGLGTHRWTIPSTWQFTDNPMVIIYNLMRGLWYPDPTAAANWQYGGQTISGAQLPFAEWSSAMNECDVLITNQDASTSKQYTAGGEIFYSTDASEEIQEFLKTCAGSISDSGGLYKPHAGAADAAVLTITDGDIMVTGDAETFTPFQPMEQTVNSVTSRYISPKHGWVEKAVKELTNPTFVAADGRKIQANLSLPHVRAAIVAQRLQQAALNEFRRERKHVLPMKWDLFQYEPGIDYIQWNSTRNGYVNKLFRIDQIDDREDLVQLLGITEVDPTDYDWHPATDEHPEPPITVRSIYVPPQGISGFAVSGGLSIGDNGATIAVINLIWATDVDDVNGVQFEVRHPSAATIAIGQTDHWETGLLSISQNIVASTTYEVRARYRSASNRTFDWSVWLPVTTPASTTVAAQLEAQVLYELSLLSDDADASLKKLEDDVAALIERVAHDTSIQHAVSYIDRQKLGASIEHIETITNEAGLAFAQLTTVLQAGIDSAHAAIVQEATVRATADSALATTIEVLDVSITGPGGAIESAITIEHQAMVDADSAQATVIEDLETSITGPGGAIEAAVLIEHNSMVSFDSAQAATIEALHATISGPGGDIDAAVQIEHQAMVDADSAQAEIIESVNAKSDAGTASGLFKIEAVSAPAGVSARLSMKLRVDSGIGTPYKVAGLYLDVKTDGLGRAFFDVDQFAIGSLGQATVPFFIDGGITYIKNANIRDGDITARHLFLKDLTGNAIKNPDFTGVNQAGALIPSVDGWFGAINVVDGGASAFGNPTRFLGYLLTVNGITAAYTDYFTVYPGEKFYAECLVHSGSASAGAHIEMRLDVADINQAGTVWASAAGAGFTSPGGWVKISGIFTVPATTSNGHAAVKARLLVYVQHTVAGQIFYFTAVRLRKSVMQDLLEDNAVSRPKIIDGAVSNRPFTYYAPTQSFAASGVRNEVDAHETNLIVNASTGSDFTVSLSGGPCLVTCSCVVVSHNSNGRQRLALTIDGNGQSDELIDQIHTIDDKSAPGGETSQAFVNPSGAGNHTFRLRSYRWAPPSSGGEAYSFDYKRAFIQVVELFR